MNRRVVVDRGKDEGGRCQRGETRVQRRVERPAVDIEGERLEVYSLTWSRVRRTGERETSRSRSKLGNLLRRSTGRKLWWLFRHRGFRCGDPSGPTNWTYTYRRP